MGAGYVGGSTMAMMAKNCPGIHVTCIDINEARVAAWNSDELPIHEPGLLPIVQAVRGKQLFFVGKDKFDETVRPPENPIRGVPGGLTRRKRSSEQVIDVRPSTLPS